MRKAMPVAIGLGVAALVCTPMVDGFADGPADRAGGSQDQWSAAEIDLLASLRLNQLPPAPLDPSNAVDGSPAAIELGKRLFNDARFSRNQAVSCATCHDPKKQFQDGLALARGVGIGSRRAMSIVGSGHSPWLFWDGRKDSLWSQALGPLEDAAEHGGNRARYAHLMQAHYRPEYEAVFRSLPDLASVPPDAGPNGTPAQKAAWAAMPGNAQHDVSRVFANMGKAIAAYEKTLVHGESRFDRYVQGLVDRDPSARQMLSMQEVRGLRIFIGKGQCVTCHGGPLFTDHDFHNTGVAPRDPANPDRGRAAAIEKLQTDEFNCLGPFSDAKPEQCQTLRFAVTEGAALQGAFKTPSLRDVSLRPPYMHAGQLESIEAVIAHYVSAPVSAVGRTELGRDGAGDSKRQPLRLSEQEILDLTSFLDSLSGSTEGVPTK